MQENHANPNYVEPSLSDISQDFKLLDSGSHTLGGVGLQLPSTHVQAGDCSVCENIIMDSISLYIIYTYTPLYNLGRLYIYIYICEDSWHFLATTIHAVSC